MNILFGESEMINQGALFIVGGYAGVKAMFYLISFFLKLFHFDFFEKLKRPYCRSHELLAKEVDKISKQVAQLLEAHSENKRRDMFKSIIKETLQEYKSCL